MVIIVILLISSSWLTRDFLLNFVLNPHRLWLDSPFLTTDFICSGLQFVVQPSFRFHQSVEKLMYMFFALIHKRCRQPLRGEQFCIEYNLNGWNTDGSFTVDDSNSVFSAYKKFFQ